VEGVGINLYALALDENIWSPCCCHRFASHCLLGVLATGKISVPVGNRVPVFQVGLCLITLMSLTYGVDFDVVVVVIFFFVFFFFWAAVKLHFSRMKNVGLKSSSNLMLLEAKKEGHCAFHYAQ
jgi:hypothetical protein